MSSPARRGASHEVVSTPLRVEARISESSDTLVPSSGELLTPNATLTSPSNGRSTPVSRCESSASSSRARTNQAHAMTNIRGMFNRRQLQPDNLLTANGQIAQVTWTQIGPGPPKQSRVCTLIQLIQRVKTKELEVSTLEGIFHESFDLLDDASLRDSTIMAFIELTRSQYGQIGIALRLNIFLRIRSIGCSFLAVEWLSVLTNDGTKIEGFEREMDFVLAEWMPKALSDQAEDISYMVLKMIQNLLLSYPHYVGPKQLAVFVSCAWRYSIYNADDRTYQCVMVLKAAAQHRHFPSKDLPATVYTMCALTQVSLADEEFAADPNKTLKIRALQVIHFLLRSSKYFTVRSLLTEILLSDAKCDTESLGEKPADTLTVNAMRGAVAAIGHAYWGAFPDAIDFPESLIPAFKRAIKYDVYACKSVLDVRFLLSYSNYRFKSLALLFERSGVELLETTWHRVVSILHFVLKQCNKIEVYKEVCGPALQQLIDLVEQLFLEQRLLCPPDFLYDMIETFSSMRSDASVMRLMDFKASLISVHDDGWPSAIHKLLGRYFRAPGQNRTRREHALNLALAFFTRNRILRQRELLTRLVTPLFSHIEREKDQVIQLKLISSLFAVAEQVSAEGCEEGLTSVLRIIRRLFNEGLLGVDSMRERRDSRTSTPRPIFSFEGPSSSPAKPSLDNCDALLLVAQQLSELTVKRWQELNASFLSEIAITFVEHLQKQYQYSLLNEEGSEALKTILSLQSHPIVHRLRRYCEDTKAYILLPNVLREGARVIGSSGTGETFGFRFICEVTSRALRTENSWAVMRTLLIGVRRVLECPDFVLTAPPDSVDELLLAILSIYERTVRTNMTKSTVEITRYLSPLLVSTLSYGLHDSRKADVCRILLELLRLQADTPEAYHAILTAVQAVPESMAKHAHSLISFIASTSLNPERSILVLELLSDAATAKDFCAIGDIVTPLLDLTRYTMYIVAHAHRVILRWFSKIPVHFREEFSCHILEKLESLKFYSAAEATPECDIIRNNSSLLNSDRSSSLSNASLCSTIEDEALQKHLAFELRTSFLQFFGIGLALRSPTIDPVALDGYKCVSSVHYVVGDSVITLSTLRKSDDSSCDTSMKSKGIRFALQPEASSRSESAGSLHDAKTSSASTHSQFEQRRRHASAVQSSVRLSSSKAPVRMASVVEELPIEKRRHKSGAGTPTEHADEFEAPGPQLVVTQMLVRHMYGRSSWIMRDVEAMHDDAFPAMIGPTSYSSLAMHMASLPSTARLGYKKTSDHVNMRIRTLDRIAAVENMAVGVLYKTVGQTTDQEMLRNVFGGHRYESFLRHLGVPYSNEEGLAGLQVDKNGEYTYVFKDEMSCIVWLVGTLMPNKDDDALCNNKRRFIGNNVVCVLWNESLTPYKVGDFCHQFIYVMIELIPNRAETIEIRVHTKPEVSEFLGAKHFFVAEAAAPTVIKNLAMRAKLAVEVYRTVADLPRGAVPYISLPVERLRKIRSLREL